MKNNKGLLFIATSLLTVIAFTIMATNQNSYLLIQSTADDESNKRSFSLDGNTPLSIDGTVGSLTVGNIDVRAPNCSILENGVATLIDTNYMFIYCSTAGTYGNSQKQQFLEIILLPINTLDITVLVYITANILI